MSFGFDAAVDAIAEDSRRLSDAVASSDLDTRVPSCPEWSLRDLAHHIGVVQWYWGANVRAADAAERSGGELTPVPGDRDLLAWLGWCSYTLLGALREAGPDAPCWTWWGEPAHGRRRRPAPGAGGGGAPLGRGAGDGVGGDRSGPSWPVTECPSSFRSWWVATPAR